MTGPIVLRPRDGRALDTFGAKLTLKATSSETGRAYSLIEGAFEPGGFAPLPHIHLDRDESFYVLEGKFDFRVGDDIVRGAEGTFLLVPRGTLHSFVNAGDTTARLLFVHSPGLEGFFFELSKLSQAGPPDAAAIGAVMREWGMEVAQTVKPITDPLHSHEARP